MVEILTSPPVRTEFVRWEWDDAVRLLSRETGMMAANQIWNLLEVVYRIGLDGEWLQWDLAAVDAAITAGSHVAVGLSYDTYTTTTNAEKVVIFTNNMRYAKGSLSWKENTADDDKQLALEMLYDKFVKGVDLV